MRSYRVSKSTSSATATSVSVFGDSQPESAIDRHQQGSFVGLSTTVHTPESRYITAAERYAELRLLTEISASQPQRDPFEVLAAYQTVSLNNDAQEQSAGFFLLPDESLLSNEPSLATDDANPIMEFEEPRPRSRHNLVDPNADSTDKWIMYSGDKTRPFKCGYEGCGKQYTRKHCLQKHFISHIGDSEFRCDLGDCAGAIRYCDKQALARHIHKKHTMERPFECDICNKRFVRLHNLSAHRRNVHSVKDEQNQPQNSDSTDKWIMYSGDKTRPFKCGYEGCGSTYTLKHALRKHFLSHIGDSQFRCYTGDCTGAIRYCDSQALARHIYKKHTMKRPYACDICPMQFGRGDHLRRHKKQVHSTESEHISVKKAKPPPKRKRK